MVYKLKNVSNVQAIVTSKIIKGMNINQFLSSNQPNTEIMTCPTDAIDIKTKTITSSCIACGICRTKYPNYVDIIDGIPNVTCLISYLRKNKMFVYKWLCLCLDEHSGIEVTTKGFSRTKRIPLIVKNNHTLYILKSTEELADIEKAKNYLNDVADLLRSEIEGYEIKQVIIVINQKSERKIISDTTIISLNVMFNRMINESKLKLKEILQ